MPLLGNVVRFHEAALANAKIMNAKCQLIAGVFCVKERRLNMAEPVGIWLHDRNLKLISKDHDALSYRVRASWVKDHADYPIKPGMTVVIGNIKPPNQLKNVLVLKVGSAELKRDGSLVISGERIKSVPKNLI